MTEIVPSRPDEPNRRSVGMASLKYGSLAVVVGLLALLVWATLAAGRGQGFVQRINAGKRPEAPAFALPVVWRRTDNWPRGTLPALADGRLSLAELRGLPVVINVWASWCLTCRDEAPVLRAASRAHAGKVVFLGLDVQDLTEDARRFARAYEMNYVSVRDRGNGTYQDYGLTGVPETFYIDARGRAVAHSPGGVTRADLERGIAAAVMSTSPPR